MKTDWNSATVERSGPFQSFADMFTADARKGHGYTWEGRSWRCAGTQGMSRGIDQSRTGSGRCVCTSSPRMQP